MSVEHDILEELKKHFKSKDDGLTKREIFASMAMQGMLASVDMDGKFVLLSALVPAAVGAADALIAELEKKP